jgi:tetraacyldisaccharide 4'-kinase
LYGRTLPNAEAACSSLVNGTAAIVILSRVWWPGNEDAGAEVKGAVSLSPATAAILKRTIKINRNNACRFIFFLYQVLQIAFIPPVALYLLYRGVRDRWYLRGLRERLGFLPASVRATGSGGVWFHAVSVGEVLSAVELIRRLREQRPHLRIYLSTTTLAGRLTADQRLSRLADAIFFAPLDYRSAVRRVLRRLRPSGVVILETEIWPNLYRESKRAGASLLIVNGRISDRALRRYQGFHWFFQYVLSQPDAIFVQSDEDRRRYALAGAPPNRVCVAGNLKYDFTPPGSGVAPDIAAFLDSLRPQCVFVAASTMPPFKFDDPDEDDAVLHAFHSLARQFPSLLLILAPRRPERFDAAATKLAGSGILFVRRTALQPLTLPGVLLLDSIGELAALFERATVVFMGGTLASRGGHNILEPAYFGKPVIAGPHLENFSIIADEFSSANALIRIERADELAAAVTHLVENPQEAARTGQSARNQTAAKRGVVDRLAFEILRAVDDGTPKACRTLPERLLFGPLSWIWRAGNRLDMASGQANRQALKTKVVSVGSLTIGGAGKSPVVAHLAKQLDEAGCQVAILTRGYRRSSSQPVVVRKGESAPLDLTGDEAQVFVRAARAHVGVGANRFCVGQRMETELAPDVFLLDDGFQHVRLKRDEDIVLIDALDPLAGGVFPLGRRREPLQSLSRATAVIVTRVEQGQGIKGIERIIRRYNPEAPIFTSRVIPRSWRGFGARELASPPADPVAAFCGLGEPRSFWRTLELLEIQVAFRRAFSDHHAYRPSDLRQLAAQASLAGAAALVTTEKDIMNLPSDVEALIVPHKLFWLEIGIEIDNEPELLRRML